LEEAKVAIDPFKPADAQINDVLEALRPIIPIRFEKVKIAVRLSGEDYGKLYGAMISYGKILQDEWQANGSWIGVLEIPAGLQSEFIDVLNKKTKGAVEVKILKG
ncbi:MAG: ribosome assembly factor SBDS, partial [Thermoplasmata archaeon]